MNNSKRCFLGFNGAKLIKTSITLYYNMIPKLSLLSHFYIF
jgi:hypothetical protein